jgi:tetratricopeptide (TPR) repeat protein
MRTLMLAITVVGFLAGSTNYGAAGVTDRPKAIEVDPSLKVTDLETKGDLARAHQDFRRAAEYYRSILRLDPSNGKVYNKLGISELKVGDLGSARSAFAKAAKLNPKEASPLNNLGAVACLEKRYKPATKYLKQALALNETDPAIHANLAEAWLGQGKVDRAMTEYSRAMELDGDIFSNHESGGMTAQLHTQEQVALVSYMIAKAYAKRGNVEGALDYLQRAKENRYPQLANVYQDQEFAGLWKDPRLSKIVPR